MTPAVDLLLNGFAQAVTPTNLLFALLGSVLGTLVGVLPGIGPTSGIAILLPLTSFLPPTPAIIMLAAIYYGAMYGGSTTSILINIPGELSSVVTTIDGYQMARQGRAGQALAIAAISSFAAGTLGIVGLTFFAPPLADFALKIGPPEYFGLVVLAMSVVVSLAGQSLLKGLSAASLGALIAIIGIDPTSGQKRLTLGNTELVGGIDFIAVIIGLFAIAEVLRNVEEGTQTISKNVLKRLMPRIREIKDCIGTILRATGIGFFLGILPGCTPGAISFISYDLEKRISKNRDQFGRGAIQGVAAPEGANNATTSGGFVPLLALGIPPTPALAVLLSGLMIYGLQPGPLLFEKQPQFVWTIIASMYVGNVMLLILNLPLVGLWAKLVAVPYHFMCPMILLFSFIGAFSVRNNFFDVWTALFFGVLGYFLGKMKIPSTPLVLSLILTPMLESSLRQSISMGAGSPILLVTRPLTLAFIISGAILAGLSLYARSRKPAIKEYILGDGQEAD
ncbi:MAG: tripartite tricarboxylate transporter permease [Desulfobacteraceae bacterium]|nr:MAG: tripartite tricarboxylate transporter permease [Desulfobacteraceae bacterium]